MGMGLLVLEVHTYMVTREQVGVECDHDVDPNPTANVSSSTCVLAPSDNSHTLVAKRYSTFGC